MNGVGHLIEVTRPHFLLVRHEGVTFGCCFKFATLYHFDIVTHTFALRVSVR
ncbi:Uncharacterised protein [Vibrio cholerae]|nr:Uncharacterised protein [Vibrio cholerae]